MPHSLIKEQEKQYIRRRKKTLKAESFFHQMAKKATKFLSDVAVLDAWSVASEVEREDGVVEEGQTERTRE
ncbi:hypothetical protein FH972_017362 [Carpinus fangiana]|uniref:Uncharacterized protein n=1 Tax=Carpinus fangiana TaxID=176857 RepID=A0A5N6RKT3_9ROSI|nr:hypothetical protein FH972_017362 [Carpinus fangiana]